LNKRPLFTLGEREGGGKTRLRVEGVGGGEEKGSRLGGGRAGLLDPLEKGKRSMKEAQPRIMRDQDKIEF